MSGGNGRGRTASVAPVAVPPRPERKAQPEVMGEKIFPEIPARPERKAQPGAMGEKMFPKPKRNFVQVPSYE